MPTRTKRTKPAAPDYTTRTKPTLLYNILHDVNGQVVRDVNGNDIYVIGTETPIGGTSRTKRTRT